MTSWPAELRLGLVPWRDHLLTFSLTAGYQTVYYPLPPQQTYVPISNHSFVQTLGNSKIDALAAELLDKMSVKTDKYSVILPTYNERQNLPVLVQMLYDTFSKE